MKLLRLFVCLFCLGICFSVFGAAKKEYVIVAGQGLKQNPDWAKVIKTLQARHGAEVVYYMNSPVEAKAELQRIRPRYVAFVERPERIGRDYVLRINRMSREIDEDIYVDFRWGIITGYDAAAALRLVENAGEPLTLRTAMSTTTGVDDVYFDRFALISDTKKGEWGIKQQAGTELRLDSVAPEQALAQFCALYQEIDPDILLTASHATERNLEIPYSLGNIKAENGKLYASRKGSKDFLKESGKRRVYFPVGNCLIGNVDNDRESMAVAWLNSANVTGMLGYVVPTWHGAGGWGTLKVWTDSPGQYTLSDAFFINMQTIQARMSDYPAFRKLKFAHETIKSEDQLNRLINKMNGQLAVAFEGEPTRDQLGGFYDEDVIVYYGDPAWNVRLKTLTGVSDAYRVDVQMEKKKCILTVTTEKWFDPARQLPCSYIFPERLCNPSPLSDEGKKMIVADDFALFYDLQPGTTYRFELKIGK